METDHSPGYGSCARYLITSVIESGLHARSMKTAEPITIFVTVGRNAGWLPAACGLARRRESDAPHILLFPEVVFDGRLSRGRSGRPMKNTVTFTLPPARGLKTVTDNT
jgi:6-phosphofructokinase